MRHGRDGEAAAAPACPVPGGGSRYLIPPKCVYLSSFTSPAGGDSLPFIPKALVLLISNPGRLRAR